MKIHTDRKNKRKKNYNWTKMKTIENGNVNICV